MSEGGGAAEGPRITCGAPGASEAPLCVGLHALRWFRDNREVVVLRSDEASAPWRPDTGGGGGGDEGGV
ncbi:hypothetical protein EYF80_042989 [Liparis tanakae]|uniref:Uncharacterized protein n=1 Tax=Liparis tanakae TaxID=230148 RepID=A0A4Z2FZZ8_9TELE|nr:hypothetical protein EYF80_042989 [Liparis tanakae]